MDDGHMKDMNSPMGKRILALVRKGDYAHAGEEEAIEVVFKDIPKDPKRILLDVGCGRGGTAGYVQDKGWGKVTGIDIDPESIDYAKKTYPDVDFLAADATALSVKLPKRFDLIYLFNVFYALRDHGGVLRELRRLSREPGGLVIFDYLIRSKTKKDFPFPEWNPIDLTAAAGLFKTAGWRITKTVDLSKLYEKWYNNLNSRIEASSEEIIALAGEEWLDFVRSFYGNIADAIKKGLLGGAAVYAASERPGGGR